MSSVWVEQTCRVGRGTSDFDPARISEVTFAIAPRPLVVGSLSKRHGEFQLESPKRYGARGRSGAEEAARDDSGLKLGPNGLPVRARPVRCSARVAAHDRDP
jgi:hypothetical protein